MFTISYCTAFIIILMVSAVVNNQIRIMCQTFSGHRLWSLPPPVKRKPLSKMLRIPRPILYWSSLLFFSQWPKHVLKAKVYYVKDCLWCLKNGENSHVVTWSIIHNPNLYLDQPITKGWCQPLVGHVPYPIDSHIATRLGLCSSLTFPALRRLYMNHYKIHMAGHEYTLW